MFARFCFVVLMLFCFVSQRDTFDLEGRYADFENERGAKAVQTAQAIVDSLGLEMAFEGNADKDAVKAELLKAILIYCSEEGDFVHTVSFGRAAIDFYREQGSLMDLAGTRQTHGGDPQGADFRQARPEIHEGIDQLCLPQRVDGVNGAT